MTAVVKLDEAYTQRRVELALHRHGGYELVSHENAHTASLLWMEYEELPWERIADPRISAHLRPVCNAYCIRKALIRKAQLAHTVAKWCAKRPRSLLRDHVPFTCVLEVDHPDYLDEALSDAFEVRDALLANETAAEVGGAVKWFLLKPSLANKGAGIVLFSRMADLVDTFERIYHASFDGDNESGHDSDTDAHENDADDGSSMEQFSFVREWVVQEYVDRPLLLHNHGSRKFHVRAYVLAVGDLSVYLYDQPLALFSTRPYSMDDTDDMLVHLTNTCLQEEQAADFCEQDSVQMLWDLCENDGVVGTDSQLWVSVFEQMKAITGELFEAAASESTAFQALPNSFELFGLDFLVDEKHCVYFLEANAFPDFKQTGTRLCSVIDQLFEATVKLALSPSPMKLPVHDESTFKLGTGNLYRVLDKIRPASAV